MTNPRVVVTGGSGFVGTNIVSYLTKIGWKVTNFDICEPRNKDHFQYWENIDLLDRDELIENTKHLEPSIFLHFGARTDLDENNDLDGYAQNIEGTCNVVDAIRLSPSIKRVIFASSQLVCMLGYTPSDEFDYQPDTMYGRSKVLFERIIRSSGEMNLIWTIVRPTSLWGPWFGVPYKELFQLIEKNRYFHIKGENPVKQWGYVGNSVYQIIKIIGASVEDVHKKTFYLADYSPVGLHDFANKVQKRLGAKPIREIPARLLKRIARLGDISQLIGWKEPPLTSFRYRNITTSEIQDLSNLFEITGPLPYSVDEGIDITVNWLSRH